MTYLLRFYYPIIYNDVVSDISPSFFFSSVNTNTNNSASIETTLYRTLSPLRNQRRNSDDFVGGGCVFVRCFRHFITIFDHAKANISMNRQIPEERGRRFLSRSASWRFCTAVCTGFRANDGISTLLSVACFARELVDIRV